MIESKVPERERRRSPVYRIVCDDCGRKGPWFKNDRILREACVNNPEGTLPFNYIDVTGELIQFVEEKWEITKHHCRDGCFPTAWDRLRKD